MKNQTVVFIVVSGVLLGLWLIFSLISGIASDIKEAHELLDQSIRETESMLQKTDSLRASMRDDGFEFDTTPIDTQHAYILKGDTSPANIFNPRNE